MVCYSLCTLNWWHVCWCVFLGLHASKCRRLRREFCYLCNIILSFFLCGHDQNLYFVICTILELSNTIFLPSQTKMVLSFTKKLLFLYILAESWFFIKFFYFSEHILLFSKKTIHTAWKNNGIYQNVGVVVLFLTVWHKITWRTKTLLPF